MRGSGRRLRRRGGGAPATPGGGGEAKSGGGGRLDAAAVACCSGGGGERNGEGGYIRRGARAAWGRGRARGGVRRPESVMAAASSVREEENPRAGRRLGSAQSARALFFFK